MVIPLGLIINEANFVHPACRLPYDMMFGQLPVRFFFGKPRRQPRYLDFFGLLARWDVMTPLNGGRKRSPTSCAIFVNFSNSG